MPTPFLRLDGPSTKASATSSIRRGRTPLRVGCQVCVMLLLSCAVTELGATFAFAKLGDGDITSPATTNRKKKTTETTTVTTKTTTTTTTTTTTVTTKNQRNSHLRRPGANSWFFWRRSPPHITVTETTTTTSTVEPQEQRRLELSPPTTEVPSTALQQEPQQQPPQQQQQPQQLQQADPAPQPVVRPMMHTFYSRVNQETYSTGMSENADDALLELWRSSWIAAGFEPRVLTIQDAERHPQYERYNQILTSEDVAVNEYDRFCFLRWLAMAVSGGGWMSDYDVMPLEGRWATQVQPDQQHQDQWDKMILYAGLPHPKPGAVPCLVRGTAAQWDHMARLLLENTVAHGQSVELWSDFYAVIDLSKSGTAVELFEIQRAVLSGHKGLVVGTSDWTPEQCQEITPAPEVKAIHFSHSAINRGKFANETTYQDRPQVAQTWLNMWSRQCANGATPALSS